MDLCANFFSLPLILYQRALKAATHEYEMKRERKFFSASFSHLRKILLFHSLPPEKAKLYSSSPSKNFRVKGDFEAALG